MCHLRALNNIFFIPILNGVCCVRMCSLFLINLGKSNCKNKVFVVISSNKYYNYSCVQTRMQCVVYTHFFISYFLIIIMNNNKNFTYSLNYRVFVWQPKKKKNIEITVAVKTPTDRKGNKKINIISMFLWWHGQSIPCIYYYKCYTCSYMYQMCTDISIKMEIDMYEYVIRQQILYTINVCVCLCVCIVC